MAEWWQVASIVATILAAFGAALLLMVSRFFQTPNLEQVAKSELIFAASTAIIVVFIIGLQATVEPIMVKVVRLAVIDSFSGYDPFLSLPITTQQNMKLIDMVQVFMQPKATCMRDVMATMYALSIPFEPMSQHYMEVFMSEVASGFIYKVITERIANTTNIIGFYLFVYYLLIHTLNFLKYAALGLFLPIGILLRSFPPTRGAGAYVMAFSIGLYFIFPLSYLLMDFITIDYASFCNIPELTEQKLVSSCGFTDQSKLKQLESAAKRNLSEAGGIMDLITLKVVKALTLSVCLLPLMAFTITLSFVLSATSLFGGNIPEVGRGLIKLI
ncbi:hypothetical protein HYT84_02685 [Candidatus Micrarchaeota archaeon]|nr:hypothetical protein [Candidatus Micrarchaeota archaeon]